jgi:hypothetical protein
VAPQLGQWDYTLLQHNLVEGLEIELLPEPTLGLGAQCLDLKSAAVVRGQLARQDGDPINHVVG